MTQLTAAQALENIYTSLNSENVDIDDHIKAMKSALPPEQNGTITVDPARLVHNNRQGRKMMQSYFKKRGLNVVFSA